VAGIGQAVNSEPGHGRRYKAAKLPSALHQDPRYCQSGRRGCLNRVGYALSRQFITRSDTGSAISAGISDLYHPWGDRTFSNTMNVWWTQVAWDSLAGIFKEFWPDIHRKLSKRKKTDPRL
jgi:hypothetical protein